MAALRDRGIFEKDLAKARTENHDLAVGLESSHLQITSLKETLASVKKKLTDATDALITSPDPDVSKTAQLERNLEEADAKIAALENKVAHAEKDRAYFSDRYQEASRGTRELISENAELKQEVEDLRRRASDVRVKVNEIQSRREARELARQLAEQKAIVREREAELNRVRDEMRSAKNGRRETRQSSVPRSPRLGSLGVMSPRGQGRAASAAVGGAGAGAGAAGGVGLGLSSGSRATSPVPLGGVLEGVGGAVMFPPAGNGRFSHLRD